MGSATAKRFWNCSVGTHVHWLASAISPRTVACRPNRPWAAEVQELLPLSSEAPTCNCSTPGFATPIQTHHPGPRMLQEAPSLGCWHWSLRAGKCLRPVPSVVVPPPTPPGSGCQAPSLSPSTGTRSPGAADLSSRDFSVLDTDSQGGDDGDAFDFFQQQDRVESEGLPTLDQKGQDAGKSSEDEAEEALDPLGIMR